MNVSHIPIKLIVITLFYYPVLAYSSDTIEINLNKTEKDSLISRYIQLLIKKNNIQLNKKRTKKVDKITAALSQKIKSMTVFFEEEEKDSFSQVLTRVMVYLQSDVSDKRVKLNDISTKKAGLRFHKSSEEIASEFFDCLLPHEQQDLYLLDEYHQIEHLIAACLSRL